MRRAVLLVWLLPIALAACDDMTHQPRQKTYSPEAAPPQQPSGMVEFLERPTAPPPLTLALMQRGQEQFRIYCTPCHGETGDGDGMIVQRGFPHPPDFTDAKLLIATPQHFYDVITKGFGVMYAFDDRVKPADRWAIAAYIRALQRSQHTAVADLTPDERDSLK